MVNIETLLKNFGLSDKETAIYTALIELGPSPVRMVAERSEVNRGTSYDILKSLIDQGLVNYFDRGTHQYFIAEPPEKLVAALERRQDLLEDVKKEISENLSGLSALYQRQGGRPMVKYYEGTNGIRNILQDVLTTMAQAEDKTYFVYSSATVRKDVYAAMPDFSKKRQHKKIRVRTIALGDGGHLVGMDERKWMKPAKADPAVTYEIIYQNKVAHISLNDAENPVGVVIENPAIYETQKMIFEFNWAKL